MLEPNSKINDLDTLVLNKCLEGWRDEALAWLRKSGWLEPAQDLEGLTWGQWSRIFNNLDGFKRKVTPGVAAKEDQQKVGKERERGLHALNYPLPPQADNVGFHVARFAQD